MIKVSLFEVLIAKKMTTLESLQTGLESDH